MSELTEIGEIKIIIKQSEWFNSKKIISIEIMLPCHQLKDKKPRPELVGSNIIDKSSQYYKAYYYSHYNIDFIDFFVDL